MSYRILLFDNDRNFVREEWHDTWALCSPYVVGWLTVYQNGYVQIDKAVRQ